MQQKIKKPVEASTFGFEKTRKILEDFAGKQGEDQILSYVLDLDFFETQDETQLLYIVPKLNNHWKKHSRSKKTSKRFSAGQCQINVKDKTILLEQIIGNYPASKESELVKLFKKIFKRLKLVPSFGKIDTGGNNTEAPVMTADDFLVYSLDELLEEGQTLQQEVVTVFDDLEQFKKSVLTPYQELVQSKKSKKNVVLDPDVFPEMLQMLNKLKAMQRSQIAYRPSLEKWMGIVADLPANGWDDEQKTQHTQISKLEKELKNLDKKIIETQKIINSIEGDILQFKTNIKLVSPNKIDNPEVNYPSIDPYKETMKGLFSFKKQGLDSTDLDKMEALLNNIDPAIMKAEKEEED